MSNVKKGDLAIVISDSCPENIGIICIVLAYVGKYEYGEGLFVEDAFHVKSECRDFEFDDGFRSDCECIITKSSLRPISGIPDNYTIDEKAPIKSLEPA